MGSTLEPGTAVAGFRIVSLIGEGAMGTVFRAEADDGQLVALKLLAPSLARDERSEPPDEAGVQPSKSPAGDERHEEAQQRELGEGAKRQTVKRLKVRGWQEQGSAQEREDPRGHGPAYPSTQPCDVAQAGAQVE